VRERGRIRRELIPSRLPLTFPLSLSSHIVVFIVVVVREQWHPHHHTSRTQDGSIFFSFSDNRQTVLERDLEGDFILGYSLKVILVRVSRHF